MSARLAVSDLAGACNFSGIECCPVCRAGGVEKCARVEGRDYFLCHPCGTRFLDPSLRLSREIEHAHYRKHENKIDDLRYRQFLSKLWDQLEQKLAPAMHGLDFGCGSGPALGAMMIEAGHTVSIYDPLFFPDRALLSKQYDFITCSEVVEHLHEPFDVFAQINSMLRPGGWLGVMTRFQPDPGQFSGWYYLKDPTHVVFYSKKTFDAVSGIFGWACQVPADDVVIMRKPAHDL